jgi:membrane-associated phospholipid phosphatase
MELVRQAPRAAMRSVLIAVCAAAFGILAALVAVGALTRFDQYSIDHWMPAFSPDEQPDDSRLVGLYRPFSLDISWWHKLVDLWTYPGSVLVSGSIFAIACIWLARRGRVRVSAIWIAAWVAGNGIEVAGKGLLHRDPLYGVSDTGIHIRSFESSFPSGHAVRATLVAALIVYLWPRFTRPALVWAVPVLPALVVSAAHVPTDVVGGVLLGLLLVLAAHAALESRFARP